MLTNLVRRPFLIAATLSFLTATAFSPTPTIQVKVTGEGKPLLLIPGLASSSETWDATVARYAPRYQCHVVSVAGFAGVPPVSDFTLDRVVADLCSYIAAQHLRGTIVIGHSLGGFLALRLAAEHSDQVSGLIIVDSLPALGAVANPSVTSEQLKQMEAPMRTQMLQMSPESRAKMARQSVESMVTSPEDVERVYGWSQKTDWPTEVTALSQMMGTDLRQEIGSIKAPAVVLGTWVAYARFGGEEGIRKSFEAQYANEHNVTIVMAPRARHFIMYDDPAWFFAQVDAFLNKMKS
jgi:pimeloyl-ACP methyl ester carboxylesterase